MSPDHELQIDKTYWGSPILVGTGEGIYVRLSLGRSMQTYGDIAWTAFWTSMHRADGPSSRVGRPACFPPESSWRCRKPPSRSWRTPMRPVFAANSLESQELVDTRCGRGFSYARPRRSRGGRVP